MGRGERWFIAGEKERRDNEGRMVYSWMRRGKGKMTRKR